MKNFLTGLLIGLPVGMLLADVVVAEPRPEMAERMREIWTDARARAEQLTTSQRAGRHTRSEEETGAILNRVTREELLAVYGIGPVLADRIIMARPYASDHDVVEREILNESTFAQLRRQVLDRYRKTA